MEICIDPNGAPSLGEADNFTLLRLVCTSPASAEVRAVLAGWGIELTSDGSHGYIDAATIPRLAGATADRAEWQEGYQRMVAYATR